MKLYSINIDWKYLIGSGDPQALILMDDQIRKSFTNGYPEINFPLEYELHKKTKITNCLSQGGIISKGFLIDDKVKMILDSCTIMQHRFYPANIFKGKKKIEISYHWLQIQEDLQTEIDYSNSVFFETMYSCKENVIHLDSYDQYKQLKTEKGIFWGVSPNSIVIKKGSKLESYDLFRFYPFDSVICISERLKNAIEEAELTGFEIEEYDKIKFV